MNKTILAILKVIDQHQGIVGSREISRQLRLFGVELTERTVRYHLRILDERGLTEVVGKEGRRITATGRDELRKGLVTDRLGFVISRIETLSFLTSLDVGAMRGEVILNISYIPEDRLSEAMGILAPVFASPYVMSDRIVIRRGGEKIGDVAIPEGRAGIGTVCSVTINGVFLKAGMPVTSRFGGIVEVRAGVPVRFISLISYEGSSVDPLEIFIKAGMTDVRGAVAGGSGSILASFREVPVVCAERARALAGEMAGSGIGGILLVGEPNRPLLEMPVGIDRVGLVVVGGLNPIAALEESGIVTESKAMSTLCDYAHLERFSEIRDNV